MFETANYIEAALWGAIGLAFAIWAAGHRNTSTRRQVAAACLFILFGLSDIVETQTGAWWRPWWLLVWKAVCVLGLVVLLLQWRARRRRALKGT